MVTLWSCEDFGDMNENPNQPLDLDDNPELLLTAVTRDLVNQMVGTGWSEGSLQSQYLARIVFTSFDQFEWGSNSSTWDQVYESGTDVNNIYKIGVNKSHDSYKAVAMILKSWSFQILTDMWGYIPYSQALQAKSESAIIYPEYDTQKDVYMGLLSDLDSANLLLSSDNLPIIDGDILFDGDLDNWRRFANSLRLRALIRLTNVESELGSLNISDEIVKILSNPSDYPLIENNSQNAVLTYLTALPNAHPQSAESGYRSGSFDEYRLSETLQTVFQSYDDPRIEQWFDPTENSVADEDGPLVWEGMINGMVDGNSYTYKGGPAYLSKFNTEDYYDVPNGMQGLLMLASEVKFILAEAAVRYPAVAGITDAQTNYEDGIKLNFEYWGVDMPTDYLTRTSNNVDWTVPVAFDGQLETILTQKWIALFYTDFQGFCEFKRTGFPSCIVPGPDAQLTVYPSRFVYPTSEQALNAASYETAVSSQGPDTYSTKVWWEN
jgi:hypothetical protein